MSSTSISSTSLQSDEILIIKKPESNSSQSPTPQIHQQRTARIRNSSGPSPNFSNLTLISDSESVPQKTESVTDVLEKLANAKKVITNRESEINRLKNDVSSLMNEIRTLQEQIKSKNSQSLKIDSFEPKNPNFESENNVSDTTGTVDCGDVESKVLESEKKGDAEDKDKESRDNVLGSDSKFNKNADSKVSVEEFEPEVSDPKNKNAPMGVPAVAASCHPPVCKRTYNECGFFTYNNVKNTQIFSYVSGGKLKYFS
ncbi:hypothetical protein HK098_006001 [Nowakowskiella sp. JEL0407]|nr:hypothetical protein HK098_006001 [Nowakowskiella sp. JEL0407]